VLFELHLAETAITLFPALSMISLLPELLPELELLELLRDVLKLPHWTEPDVYPLY